MKKVTYIIILVLTLIALSCSKSPTNPSGGGGGSITEPEPTPNEFAEKLKTIGIIRAGDQEWNFVSLTQSQNILK